MKCIRKCSTSVAISVMQIKSTLIFHLTTVQMTKIVKPIGNECWQESEERGNPYSL